MTVRRPPSLTLPHSMGEGEGGGPFLVKWKISDDLAICRSDEFRTFNRSTGQPIPELLHERRPSTGSGRPEPVEGRFTRKRSGSAIAAETFMSHAG